MGRKPKTNRPALTHDLESFQNAVNESASRVRGLWLGYIALLTYLLISVLTVTHRDLLLENRVNLPVLQVELSLIGFFSVAPIFFLINHFFLLLQLFGLGQRLQEFNNKIGNSSFDGETLHRAQRKLDTFVIVQLLAGPKKDQELLTSKFLGLISIITLVIAPISLLVIIQMQFLPFQNQMISWLHRMVLAVDLVLLWMLWPSIKLGDWAPWLGNHPPIWQGRLHWRKYMDSWRRCCVSWWQTLALFIVLFFACTIATFPGEFADGGIYAKNWSKPDDSYFSSLKGLIFGDLSHGEKREGLFPFARAIALEEDKTLIDFDRLDKINRRFQDKKDILKPWEAGRTLSLRNRILVGAMFDRTDLRNAELNHANLQGASLVEVNLQGASLKGARLQGTSLKKASLQGVALDEAILRNTSLDDANLQYASLNQADLKGASLKDAILLDAVLTKANLEGAILSNASLQKAKLDNASLKRASLNNANLQNASLAEVDLQGASLIKANLQNARLYKAHLEGATLDSANLQGAELVRARLEGASLNSANLQGAVLDSASLQGASLFSAKLQGASLLNAWLQGVSLDDANLQVASLDGANLQGASLVRTNLQGASLNLTNLQDVSLDLARLQGASLNNATLQGASLNNTYTWRTYGTPLRGKLDSVWVKSPQLLSFSEKELEQLEKQSLEDVNSQAVKSQITILMTSFSEPKENLEKMTPPDFWIDLEGKMNDLIYRKDLATRLETQICDTTEININSQPLFVAQGLIGHRLEAIGTDHLASTARRLLDYVEGKNTYCIGLKGLNAKSIGKLRGWANGP